MTAASRAIASQGLKRRALSLGAVKAFDHGMQFLLPVILVRVLDAATFGEYRLLWLAIGTVVALATLNMGGGLYYFVPRSDAWHKRLYIHHALLYFAIAGLACAWILSPWNPFLPAAVRPLGEYGLLVPALVSLWMLAVLLDYLPTIDEEIGLQAYATISVSLLRATLVGLGAWLTGELTVILWLLIAVVVIKLAMLLVYVHRRHGLARPWFQWREFSAQFRHCAPFGVSNALYSLRTQTDQWVAASLFAIGSFAAFSIAAVLGQIVNVFRHAVMEAFMPSMSRMEAAGDVRAMMEMNARANAIVGTLLYPLFAYTFVFAEEIVTFVYTAAYLEAAPVMRVYIVGMALLVIEVGSVLLLLRQGPYALGVNSVALLLSVTLSWLAAGHIGLTGAAMGSVLALYFDRALVLRRIAACAGIRLARLQDWRGLARALACAAFAAFLAWAAVDWLFPHGHPVVRLAVGALVLGAVYCTLNLRRGLK